MVHSNQQIDARDPAPEVSRATLHATLDLSIRQRRNRERSKEHCDAKASHRKDTYPQKNH